MDNNTKMYGHGIHNYDYLLTYKFLRIGKFYYIINCNTSIHGHGLESYDRGLKWVCCFGDKTEQPNLVDHRFNTTMHDISYKAMTIGYNAYNDLEVKVD